MAGVVARVLLTSFLRGTTKVGINAIPTPTLSTLRQLVARVARVGAEELDVNGRAFCARALSRAAPRFGFNRTRTLLLRAAGIRIGARSIVMGPLDITGPGHVRELFSIGESTYISGPLHVDVGAPVRIGNRVQFGHHVVLLTVEHEIGPSESRCGALVAAPISIGDGVWLGSCVTVLPGVSIGHGAIVATGAVVCRDVAPNTLVGGVPARLIRELDVYAPKGPRWARAIPLHA